MKSILLNEILIEQVSFNLKIKGEIYFARDCIVYIV